MNLNYSMNELSFLNDRFNGLNSFSLYMKYTQAMHCDVALNILLSKLYSSSSISRLEESLHTTINYFHGSKQQNIF